MVTDACIHHLKRPGLNNAVDGCCSTLLLKTISSVRVEFHGLILLSHLYHCIVRARRLHVKHQSGLQSLGIRLRRFHQCFLTKRSVCYLKDVFVPKNVDPFLYCFGSRCFVKLKCRQLQRSAVTKFGEIFSNGIILLSVPYPVAHNNQHCVDLTQ